MTLRHCPRTLLSWLTGVAALASFACGSPTPDGPDLAQRPAAAGVEVPASAGDVGASNAAPALEWSTQPPANRSAEPDPTVSGRAPLTVRFNLCRSTDSDQGDSLNWQFHFGDSGLPAFAADGSFNADAGHQCRVDHTYQEGEYVATIAVTDKHLEDQGADVSALARTVQRIRVVASSGGSPAPAPKVGACPNGVCLVFVSNLQSQGDFFGSGVAGADQLCQSSAQAASLPDAATPGSYRAWISDDRGNSPSVSFSRSTGPYQLVSGTTIANDWADLTDGTLAAPINVTELGGAYNGSAWTHTQTDGTPGGNQNLACSNWTSTSMAAFGDTGTTTVPSPGPAGAYWTVDSDLTCDTYAPVYCFQQP
jgi:hypothetical protein